MCASSLFISWQQFLSFSLTFFFVCCCSFYEFLNIVDNSLALYYFIYIKHNEKIICKNAVENVHLKLYHRVASMVVVVIRIWAKMACAAYKQKLVRFLQLLSQWKSFFSRHLINYLCTLIVSPNCSHFLYYIAKNNPRTMCVV